MSKIKTFDIIYSNSSGVYYAGQQVSGKVVVELQESMRIRAVKIRCHGEASVSFSDATKTGRSHLETLQYFDQNEIVFGNVTTTSITGSDAPVLNAGHHEFPFAFCLPDSLPSSFESKVGHVRFYCKAYLVRPWKFDHTTKKAFTIVAIVDINNEPGAFTPGVAAADRKFGLTDKILGCMRGGLSVHMKTPRSAYVPGENILLSAEVTNNSSVHVRSIEAFIVQNVICTAKTGSRFFTGADKIGLITRGGLNRGQELILHNEEITIPPLPPSKLGGCRLINVDYLLKFLVHIEGQQSVILTLPIVIGTVPLRPTPRATPGLPRQPSAPPLEDYLGPPPSYEESAFMERADIHDADDDQHLMGDMSYRPRYPLYPTLPIAAAMPVDTQKRYID